MDVWKRYEWIGRGALKPANWVLVSYRISHALYLWHVPLLPRLLRCLAQVVTSADIDHRADIGPGFIIFHGQGLVIGRGVKIGRDCAIFQNVTLGIRMPREHDDRDWRQYPTLGNGVHIYSGAVVLGPVTIGDNVTIAANTVVMQDVPANTTVLPVPIRVMPSSAH